MTPIISNSFQLKLSYLEMSILTIVAFASIAPRIHSLNTSTHRLAHTNRAVGGVRNCTVGQVNACDFFPGSISPLKLRLASKWHGGAVSESIRKTTYERYTHRRMQLLCTGPFVAAARTRMHEPCTDNTRDWPWTSCLLVTITWVPLRRMEKKYM